MAERTAGRLTTWLPGRTSLRAGWVVVVVTLSDGRGRYSWEGWSTCEGSARVARLTGRTVLKIIMVTTLDTYSHMRPDADQSTRAAISNVMTARADSLRSADSLRTGGVGDA